MGDIKFNKGKFLEEIKTSKKPTINIKSVCFNSNDNDWIERLYSAHITLKTTGVDNEGKEVCHVTSPISFAAYISPNHRQPSFKINHYENFRLANEIQFNSISYWKTSIVLEGITFKEQELLTLIVNDDV